MSRRTLSKSDFKQARTCAAKLFFRENRYPDNRNSNPYLDLLADGGYMVEALAKARYTSGIQLSYGADPAEDFAATIRALQQENVVLFEATMLVDRQLARIDILDKKGSNVRLVEVKSKSFDGAAHAESLSKGGTGIFRSSRRPYAVKAEWLETIEDVAFQLLLLERALPGLTINPHLTLVDKSKTAGLDAVPSLFELIYNEHAGVVRTQTARYCGTAEQLRQLDLLTEVEVSAEVENVREGVRNEAHRFESRLDAPLVVLLEDVRKGAECRTCEFRVDVTPSGFRECWGDLADARPHVLELYSAGTAKAPDGAPLIEWAFSQGNTALVDIPFDGLRKADGTVGATAERQRRQIEQTRRNEVFISAQLRPKIDALQGRLHFIDFEGSRLALPYHAGMRPYANVAFQWSCHTVDSLGEAPNHTEWLNDTDAWPNQSFAESLRTAIGDTSTVLVWSGYEGTTLRHIAEDLAHFGRDAGDLAAWIEDVVEHRIVDLHAWVQTDYFHPTMGGRTGIKYVLDAIWPTDSEMRRQFVEWTSLPADQLRDPYASLPALVIKGTSQNVHEGTGAMRAYQEMMYGSDRRDAAVRAQWSELLKQYCKLDTLSMLLIVEHWRRVSAI